MMNSSICTALFLNALIMLSLLILYFKDPDFFYSKMYLRIHKIKFMFRTSFGKSGKEYKEKYRLLSNAVRDCEYTVCRYVNKKNLSTLSEDETLHNLLKHYKELLYIQSLPEEEVTIEKISDEMSEIENLYFSDMDPYYQEDFEELA